MLLNFFTPTCADPPSAPVFKKNEQRATKIYFFFRFLVMLLLYSATQRKPILPLLPFIPPTTSSNSFGLSKLGGAGGSTGEIRFRHQIRKILFSLGLRNFFDVVNLGYPFLRFYWLGLENKIEKKNRLTGAGVGSTKRKETNRWENNIKRNDFEKFLYFYTVELFFFLSSTVVTVWWFKTELKNIS